MGRRWFAVLVLLLASALAGAAALSTARDLSLDERAGGHTLARHVAKTDVQLAERLRAEPRIATASTWTDRATAERVVGETLEREKDRIAAWLGRTSHPNLVLEHRGTATVGRSLERGKRAARPAHDARIVLRWREGGRWFVLTAYPT